MEKFPYRDESETRKDHEVLSPNQLESQRHGCGNGPMDCYEITAEDLRRLQSGEVLCFDAQGEYSLYVRLGQGDVDDEQ